MRPPCAPEGARSDREGAPHDARQRSCAQNSTRARIKGLTLSRCPPPAPFEAGLAEGCIPIARYSCTTLAALETLNSIHCNTRPRRTPPPTPPAHRFELPLGQPRLWRDRASLTQRLEWWRAAYAARPLEFSVHGPGVASSGRLALLCCMWRYLLLSAARRRFYLTDILRIRRRAGDGDRADCR